MQGEDITDWLIARENSIGNSWNKKTKKDNNKQEYNKNLYKEKGNTRNIRDNMI